MLSGFCSFYGTKVLLFFKLGKCFGKKVIIEGIFLRFEVVFATRRLHSELFGLYI